MIPPQVQVGENLVLHVAQPRDVERSLNSIPRSSMSGRPYGHAIFSPGVIRQFKRGFLRLLHPYMQNRLLHVLHLANVELRILRERLSSTDEPVSVAAERLRHDEVGPVRVVSVSPSGEISFCTADTLGGAELIARR